MVYAVYRKCKDNHLVFHDKQITIVEWAGVQFLFLSIFLQEEAIE